MLPSRAGGVISYPMPDLQTLYSSYLSFVQGGALFIPSNRNYPLGEQVFVVVTLPESSDRIPLTGKVVWVTHRSQGIRPAGFGVSLDGEEGARLKVTIEKMLTGLITQEKPTFTL